MPENNKNMKLRKERPQREKGAASPQYMPAIFGWMKPEYQREQARELNLLSKSLNLKKD
ncbi:MAG: hypothetical protein ACOCV3_01835 [Halanaerobiales bacterium]